jgi:hypothetical protein
MHMTTVVAPAKSWLAGAQTRWGAESREPDPLTRKSSNIDFHSERNARHLDCSVDIFERERQCGSSELVAVKW